MFVYFLFPNGRPTVKLESVNWVWQKNPFSVRSYMGPIFCHLKNDNQYSAVNWGHRISKVRGWLFLNVTLDNPGILSEIKVSTFWNDTSSASFVPLAFIFMPVKIRVHNKTFNYTTCSFPGERYMKVQKIVRWWYLLSDKENTFWYPYFWESTWINF